MTTPRIILFLVFSFIISITPQSLEKIVLVRSQTYKAKYLPPVSEKIDYLLQAYAALYQFNGTALAYQKGKIILNKGYGMRNANEALENDRNTIFQLGSVTKQFTCAAILKLQAKGKLKVSDKLSKYFPFLSYGDKISVENLMTHTSGIYNYTSNSNFMNNEATKPASREKVINLFKDMPLEFEPGTKFSYSNSGYSLLGYIIEDVTGRKYEEVVRELIFQPLRMDHSGFDFASLKNSNKAVGYLTYNAKLKLPAQLVDSTVSYSAGSMYSTTEDLLKWHKGLMNNQVLDSEQQKNAYSPFRSNYGYGWTIDSIFGKRRIAHGGGIFGFISSFVRIPENDLCIILLCNSNSARLESIHPKILAILNDQPYELPRERKEISLAVPVLRQYAGEYEISEDRKLTVTVEDSSLMIQPTGQFKLHAFAERENYFFLKVSDTQIEFVKGADGKVGKLLWYQGGKTTVARKIH